MKKKIISLLVILSAASLFALAYFSNQLKPSISASPSASPVVSAVHPSPSPSPSPDVTYTVKADYSQLTPYEPMEEIYTRLSEDDMAELVPSEDYGLLLPYTGEVLYNDIYGDMSPIASRRGLVTLDGMMVTDAVFSDINNPYIYDEYSNSYSQKPLYILEKYLVDETVLFQISHDDYFAYMDTSGTYRFKLSLEDCTAD